MDTPLQQQELNTELQEMYLITQGWISDSVFVDTELEIITSHLSNSEGFRKVGNIKKQETIGECAAMLAIIKQEFINELHLFKYRLQTLITRPEVIPNMELLNQHFSLNVRRNMLLGELKAFRTMVFMMAKGDIHVSQNRLESFCFNRTTR